MIIVTGCDNTGKSSLVKFLSKELDMPVAKRFPDGPPKTKDQWDEWYWYCERAFNDPEDKIYDRLFIDEFVYGPVMRGGLDLTISEMANLSQLMLIRQPLYIYTDVPLEVIRKSFDDRDQYPQMEMIGKLLSQFSLVNNSWPVNQLRSQYTFDFMRDPDYSIILSYLRNFPEKYKGGNIYGKRS